MKLAYAHIISEIPTDYVEKINPKSRHFTSPDKMTKVIVVYQSAEKTYPKAVQWCQRTKDESGRFSPWLVHRENAPAVYKFAWQSSIVKTIIFYQDGRAHKELESGPALLSFNEDGRCIASVFFLRGQSYSRDLLKYMKVAFAKRQPPLEHFLLKT